MAEKNTVVTKKAPVREKAQAYGEARFSDVVIRCDWCGGYEWPAFKILLVRESEVLAQMLSEETKEILLSSDDRLEGENNTLVDASFTPQNIEAMLYFCWYKNKYEHHLHYAPARTHAEMYQLAQKLKMKKLRKKALRVFRKKIAKDWMGYDFAEVTRILFDEMSADDLALRDAVVVVASEHASELLAEGRYFRRIAEDLPDLGVELSITLSQALTRLRTSTHLQQSGIRLRLGKAGGVRDAGSTTTDDEEDGEAPPRKRTRVDRDDMT